jgi:hypothetical protein
VQLALQVTLSPESSQSSPPSRTPLPQVPVLPSLLLSGAALVLSELVTPVLELVSSVAGVVASLAPVLLVQPSAQVVSAPVLAVVVGSIVVSGGDVVSVVELSEPVPPDDESTWDGGRRSGKRWRRARARDSRHGGA